MAHVGMVVWLRRSLGLGLASVLVLGGACGDGAGSTPAEGPGGSTESSPFLVEAVPAGYQPVTAGTGTSKPDWGSDSTGTHEPFTVLAPEGSTSSADVVVVSLTGFEGYQGGLAQASAGYLAPQRVDLESKGWPVIYVPPDPTGRSEHWADLVVEVGEDVAVRVTAATGTARELMAIAEHVEVPEDHGRPPIVADPPDGLEVIGSVDAQAVMAMYVHVAPNTDAVPGGESAHGAGWLREGSPDSQLSVVSLPGASVDLDAMLAAAGRFGPRGSTWRSAVVAGRPALVTDVEPDPSGWRSRAVWLDASWGDVVVATATGTEVPDEEAMVALAASVHPTDEQGWDDFVVRATGGPGLHPDAGRVELARGEVADVEWILQTGPPGGGRLLGTDIDLASTRGVDPCLKLSTRRRACASSGGGGADDWIMSTEDEGLAFVVVSTTIEASSVRITTPDEVATVPLVPVPGGGLWAAVAFVESPGPAVCPAAGPPPPSMEPHVILVEALDAAGGVIGCLGLAGLPRSEP